MEQYYPKGKNLPALEKNILKYRALEMVIILFYAQEIKRLVKSTIETSNDFRKHIGEEDRPELPKKMDDFLLSQEILEKAEVEELRALLGYRNDIGHRVQNLTCDLNRDNYTHWLTKSKGIDYDYQARQKIKAYYEKIREALGRKFVMSLTPDTLLFEAAERAYEEELKRLDKKIRKQLQIRKDEIQALNKELKLPKSFQTEEKHPYHPYNQKRNGNLTARGEKVCYELFDAGKSVLAVSYLMRVSYKSVYNRYKKWKQFSTSKKQA